VRCQRVRPPERPGRADGEIKNLNCSAFSDAVGKGQRQIDVVQSGGRVSETRLWDTAAGHTVSMRSKEEGTIIGISGRSSGRDRSGAAAGGQRRHSETPAALRARLKATHGFDAEVVPLTTAQLAGYLGDRGRWRRPANGQNWLLGAVRRMNETGRSTRLAARASFAFAARGPARADRGWHDQRVHRQRRVRQDVRDRQDRR
jgi:hypothetical protein